jgi:hypothetical protein
MLHIWVALGFIIILDQGVHPAHAQQFYYMQKNVYDDKMGR